jgi:hypothetical protein
MLALDDAALARLCIGATAVAPEDRCRWLQNIARRIDPPHHIINQRARNRRARERRRKGRRIYRLELSDRTVEGAISALIASGALTEAQAKDQKQIERELARHLEGWATHWREILTRVSPPRT